MVSKPFLKKLTPEISVVLPVYNAEKYISTAMSSILKQSFRNFEFIIIDDHSSDNSWEIIQQYARKDKRIIALRNNRNLKGCATLNKGLALAKGKYIARVDNDDWSYPYRFDKQYSYLEAHPQVGIVGGVMEIMNEEGKILGKRKYHISDQEIRKSIFRYSPFSHPLVMIRKSILDKIGYYNSEYVPADDYELYFRIGKVSKFANLPEVLLKYRIVSGSMTHNLTKKMELATISVRRKYSHDTPYKMSFIDELYTFLHYLSVYIFPSKLKMRLFNLIRNSD